MKLNNFKYNRTSIALLSILLSVGFFWGANLSEIQAQTFHQSISTAGNNAAGAGGSVSYTAGQVYYITKTGAGGSVAEGIQNCVVNCDPAFQGFLAITNVLCFGATTGDIDLTVNGGYGPFTYRWSNGPTTQDLTDVAAGTYTVIIRDARGCTTIASGTITQPTELTLSTTHTDLLCFGDTDGEAEVTPSGGVAPYLYSWNSAPPQTTATATGLVAGTYTVTVTDNNGCNKTASVTITQPTALLVATSKTDVLCNGNTTGAATATPSGGTGAYTYLWSTGETSASVSGLAAGAYTVTVTDDNLCQTIENVDIFQPAAPITIATTQINVVCFGGSTGSATATPSGGTAPYDYLWSNGGTTSTISGLSEGLYTVTVTDDNGCTEVTSVTITQPPTGMSGSITAQTNVLCFGDATGSVTVLGSGGTPPYNYSLDGGAFQASGTFSGLAAGSYIVTVNNLDPTCTFDLPVEITEPAQLSVSITQDYIACIGESTGTATATPSGGVGPYTYLWSNGTTNQTATGLAVGSYSVEVTDFNGCKATNNIMIIVHPASVGGTVAGSTTVCFGTNSTSLTLSGETGLVTKWQSTVDGWATTVDIANTTNTLIATNLTATTTYRAVVKSGTCSETNSAVATISVDPTSIGGTIAGATNVCFGTNSTTLILSGETGLVTKWQSTVDGWLTTVDIVNTTNTLIATNLTATTTYRAVVKSGTCSETNSAETTITIDPTSIGGTIAGSTSGCFGANLSSLILSGETGLVTKWQSTVDGWVTTVDIANTTNTLIATDLTATTTYRAVVKSGTCSETTSAEATITIDPITVGGTQQYNINFIRRNRSCY